MQMHIFKHRKRTIDDGSCCGTGQNERTVTATLTPAELIRGLDMQTQALFDSKDLVTVSQNCEH